jgi:hypothetical protein
VSKTGQSIMSKISGPRSDACRGTDDEQQVPRVVPELGGNVVVGDQGHAEHQAQRLLAGRKGVVRRGRSAH